MNATELKRSGERRVKKQRESCHGGRGCGKGLPRLGRRVACAHVYC